MAADSGVGDRSAPRALKSRRGSVPELPTWVRRTRHSRERLGVTICCLAARERADSDTSPRCASDNVPGIGRVLAGATATRPARPTSGSPPIWRTTAQRRYCSGENPPREKQRLVDDEVSRRFIGETGVITMSANGKILHSHDRIDAAVGDQLAIDRTAADARGRESPRLRDFRPATLLPAAPRSTGARARRSGGSIRRSPRRRYHRERAQRGPPCCR